MTDRMPGKISPMVSCVVPCFNEDIELLKISLNSLMNQSFRDFECIVIDESTNRHIAEACRKLCQQDARFIYIHPNERLGLAASLNMAIKMSKGVFVARFDSDDVCRFDRLLLQTLFLINNPEISVVGSAVEIIDGNGKVISHRTYPYSHLEIKKEFIFYSALSHPSAMIRKIVLDGYEEPYDPLFEFSEDLDLWLRLLNRGAKFANLPDKLIQYRQKKIIRDKSHWKFNIKARIKNLSHPDVIKKLIGIVVIVIFPYLPKVVKQLSYKIIHLRRA